jgi:hypothetical protein
MNSHGTSLSLESRQIVALDYPAGHVINVRAGRLWITQERDFTDYIVEAGGTFVMRPGGRTLAGALAPSVLDVVHLNLS